MTNVWYVKYILANCDGNMYLPILQLPRVELHCKLHEKLHRVTGPLGFLKLFWRELWANKEALLREYCYVLSRLGKDGATP